MRTLESVLNEVADVSDKLANTVRALDKTAKGADLIGFVLPSGQAMKAVRMSLAGGSGKVRAMWSGVVSFFGGGASAGRGLSAASGGLKLTESQASNLARFNQKLPKGSTGTQVHKLGDGVMFTAEVPGKVPGSKAVYQKAVDANGVTTRFTKTTFDPLGKIVHIKSKLP
jgi:hypothetical protein